MKESDVWEVQKSRWLSKYPVWMPKCTKVSHFETFFVKNICLSVTVTKSTTSKIGYLKFCLYYEAS